MARPKVKTALLVAVPLLILLLPVAVYLVDTAVHSGEVPRNVSVAGVPVAGLGETDAVTAVRAHEARLQTEPAVFVVNGRSYELDPLAVGFSVEAEGAVAAAMDQRQAGLVSGFVEWLRSFSDPIEVELVTSVDPDAVADELDTWEADAIPNRAYNGTVEMIAGEVRYEYPQTGQALDKPSAQTIVAEALAVPDRAATELPLTDDPPQMTADQIDAAVEEIEALIDRPVTLRNETADFAHTFQADEIAAAVQVTISLDPPTGIDISLKERVVGAYVEPFREAFETEPVNASFEVDEATGTVTIIPSTTGTRFDRAAVTDSLYAAALAANVGDFPIAEGTQPQFSTEDAEGFGPLGLVSEFTTKHKCCENRVHNIQLMADTIDGSIVWPGEEFSINEAVGQRTEAKGYLRDGAIIAGEVSCCDSPANVGGGVSQFGTTFYNAVFFGCYEDLEHTPHSLYISRYPEGREATLGFPAPDVRFRNDSDAPVIIKTSHTSGSITVTFYGNNGGRTCTSEKSERFNPTEAKVRYEANPSVPPGTQQIVSKGSGGWSVTITRTITYPDGTTKSEPYTHRYRGTFRKIAVHPCDLGGTACPIQVTGVVGLDEASAAGALIAAGFVPSVGYIEVDDPSQAGIVLAQSPDGGAWIDQGTAVAITVGVDNQPNPEPPPPPEPSPPPPDPPPDPGGGDGA
jgi:vancomycin resistance protein YoaR